MPLVLEPSWVGRRVSIRRVADHGPDGRTTYRDVVGDLVGLDAQTAVVGTRQGLVEVPLEQIAIARLVPPSTADELALERIVAAGWRPEETEDLDGWLLRASGGFTGRANSVLPLGAARRPLDDAIHAVLAWYSHRGLPARFQVPMEARRLLDAALGERGWSASPPVHVMACRLDTVARRAPEVRVEISSTPDDAWLRRVREGRGLEPAARALLARHERAAFAAIRDTDATVTAVGRGTLDDGWLGVTAVEVVAERRGEGLATAVMHALWQWAVDAGAVRSHLEVSSDNAPALALYEKLGYWVHHDYRYRAEPGVEQP